MPPLLFNPFSAPPPFVRPRRAKAKTEPTCVRDSRVLYFPESHSGGGGGDSGGDGKKPGIVASTRTRSLPLVPPTLKSRTHDNLTVRALYPASLNYNAEEK